MEKHIITINTESIQKTAQYARCSECQTSCQSACKTSCTTVRCLHASGFAANKSLFLSRPFTSNGKGLFLCMEEL